MPLPDTFFSAFLPFQSPKASLKDVVNHTSTWISGSNALRSICKRLLQVNTKLFLSRSTFLESRKFASGDRCIFCMIIFGRSRFDKFHRTWVLRANSWLWPRCKTFRVRRAWRSSFRCGTLCHSQRLYNAYRKGTVWLKDSLRSQYC